ncbi:MAG TPA: hypothetical protein VMH81_00500 [Bryobacteraceae bacterium]|nr:hypothetical protein [Bryobacteraceae bacterium]
MTVEYEFLNTTNQDITVGDHIPHSRIRLGYLLSPSIRADLFGWRVWVEGKELKYQTEIKAIAEQASGLPGLPDGVDQAPLLRRLSVDVESFGHFQVDGMVAPDFQRLTDSSARGTATRRSAGGGSLFKLDCL